jgi:hypothetical protein
MVRERAKFQVVGLRFEGSVEEKGKKGDLVSTVSMETRKAKERESVALESNSRP